MASGELFTHYEGGHRDDGIDEGATLILHTEEKDSWFWSIPLPYDRTSIGVVGEIDYLLQDRRDANGRLKPMRSGSSLKNSQSNVTPLQQRLEGAKQLFPIQSTKDFSYRASRIAGNNWVLETAMRSGSWIPSIRQDYFSQYLKSDRGEMAADAIIEAFQKDDFLPSAAWEFRTSVCRRNGGVSETRLRFLYKRI